MYQTNKSHSFILILLRFLLVLSFLVGTLAVLPQPAQAAGKTSNPVISAKIGSDHDLRISATNLIPNRYYVVKVSSTQGNARVGKYAASKQGKITTAYTLAGKLAKARRVKACLKDSITGRNYCAVATH